MCACVNEGQFDPVGVSGAGRPCSPGQGAPATAVGIPSALGLWHRAHAILKRRAASTRNPASPPSRLALDTAQDSEATPAKFMLPYPQTCRPQDVQECMASAAETGTSPSQAADLQTL